MVQGLHSSLFSDSGIVSLTDGQLASGSNTTGTLHTSPGQRQLELLKYLHPMYGVFS